MIYEWKRSLKDRDSFERVTDKFPYWVFAFIQNADLNRWIDQSNIYKKLTDLAKDWTQVIS